MTVPLIKMYDDVNLDLEPFGAAAYAAYVDGRFANYQAAVARFAPAYVLPIAVFATSRARCLDIEQGDAVPGEWPGFYQANKGKLPPVAYHSVLGMDEVVSIAAAAAIPRSAYYLWTAHYTGQAHLCGPRTCGQMQNTADATQYTDTADSRSLDETLAQGYFTGTASRPPTAEVTLNVTLPVLTEGDTDPVGGKRMVRRVQALCAGLGSATAIDGVYGPATKAAVEEFQAGYGGLTVDGTVGPHTWYALIAG